MAEQEFADMFERYAKTRRGIEFLTGYFQKMMKHCEISHNESECFGVEHEVNFYDIVDNVAMDFEEETKK